MKAYFTTNSKRKMSPTHAMKISRDSGGTAPLILNLGTRRK